MNIAFRCKQCIAKTLDVSGLPDFFLKWMKPKIILGYHRVLTELEASENMSQDCMWVSPSNFEKQIQWMLKVGTITSIEALVNSPENVSKPTFAITFDDGWKDNYEHAFPILKKYNIPAMIFLSTDAIEKDEMFWPEEIFYKTSRALRQNKAKNIFHYFSSLEIMKRIKKNGDINELLNCFIEKLKLLSIAERKKAIASYYDSIQASSTPVHGHILNWNQVREMQQYNISFGSHTHNHMITEGSDKKAILDELLTSKKIIENKLGIECKWFCYPNARFNSDDHILLREARYDYGVTLHCAWLKQDSSPYYLPRFIMYKDITEILGYIKLRFLGMPFF